jgi:hypothetical protein
MALRVLHSKAGLVSLCGCTAFQRSGRDTTDQQCPNTFNVKTFVFRHFPLRRDGIDMPKPPESRDVVNKSSRATTRYITRGVQVGTWYLHTRPHRCDPPWERTSGQSTSGESTHSVAGRSNSFPSITSTRYSNTARRQAHAHLGHARVHVLNRAACMMHLGSALLRA